MVKITCMPSAPHSRSGKKCNDTVKDNLLCVSCPRGSHLSFWDTTTRTFIDQQIFSDVSGLAYSHGNILASSGKGLLKTLNHNQPVTRTASIDTLALKFDNHMTMIDAG